MLFNTFATRYLKVSLVYSKLNELELRMPLNLYDSLKDSSVVPLGEPLRFLHRTLS